MRSASGRWPHCAATVAAATLLATSWSPVTRASRRTASRSLSSSRGSALAPASPDSGGRLVTSTAQAGSPGSSGRTWASLIALSSTTNTRLPERRLRKARAAASSSAGISWLATPSAWRNWLKTTPGSRPSPSSPRKSTKSCPSGNSSHSSWAACIASADLPTPAGPLTATMMVASATSGLAASSRHSSATSAERPVKSAMSGGSSAGITHVVGAGAIAFRAGRAASRLPSPPLPAAVRRSTKASSGMPNTTDNFGAYCSLTVRSPLSHSRR